MDTHSFPWARAVFAVPFLALLVFVFVFSCDMPSSDDGASPSSRETVVATATGSPTAAPPTVAPVTVPAPPVETGAPPTEPPMDGHDEAPPPPPPPVATAAPDPAGVDFRDSVAVSRAAVTTLWSVDTAKDAGPLDADRRAAPYFSAALNYEVQLAPTTGGQSPEWSELASHHGKTVVDAVLTDEAGKPSDTPTEARHSWALTVTPVADDGWRGVPESFTVFVTLSRSRADQPWLVTDYQSA